MSPSRLQPLGCEPWSALGGPFFYFLAQAGIETALSGILGIFQSRGAFSGRRGLTIECLLMSGCGQIYELEKNI